MTSGTTIHPPSRRTVVPTFHAEAGADPGFGSGAAPRTALTIHRGLTVQALIDLGFATIEAQGIDDCEELFEAFRLPPDEPLRFARYSCRLAERWDETLARRTVIYVDKRWEVRMSVEEYRDAQSAVCRLLSDPRTQAALAALYAGLTARESGEVGVPD